ncbi:MAG: phosphopentomutase [Nitratireductor sp.]|nr:phosphopentomutase [Nitratireductor sp.]
MSRAFLFVLDSVGIGGAPDAAQFGDEGANTIGHIAEACHAGKADQDGLRAGTLSLPVLESLGLGLAAENACGKLPAGMNANPELKGRWASAVEISKGKDTPSGHWEIAGVPVMTDWGYFPREIPAFPAELTERIIAENSLPGILGNCHASGTEIIAELGEAHVRTGKPICYTSSDSVFQIAAHEHHFGLEKLYALCESVFEMTAPMNIGRVIARPFIGEDAASFARTGNRRDYSIKPPKPTLLERAKAAGREVIAIGKIADIYAHQGPTQIIKASGNEALGAATLKAMVELPDGGLLMTNFVDFDMLYGHRRNVAGYAAALEDFDCWLPSFMEKLEPGDLLAITADHGCDPTWQGTDHTREQVPVLLFGGGIEPGNGGTRETFADIGATVARHLGLEPGETGTPIRPADA